MHSNLTTSILRRRIPYMLHRPACESDFPAELQVCCAAVMSDKDIASDESPRRAHKTAIKPGMQAESSPKKPLSASTPPFTPLILRSIDLASIKSPAQDTETAQDFSFPKFTHTQLESASSAPPTPTQRLNVSYQQAMRYSYDTKIDHPEKAPVRQGNPEQAQAEYSIQDKGLSASATRQLPPCQASKLLIQTTKPAQKTAPTQAMFMSTKILTQNTVGQNTLQLPTKQASKLLI